MSAASTMARVEGPPEPTTRPVRSLETSAVAKARVGDRLLHGDVGVAGAGGEEPRRAAVDHAPPSRSAGAPCTWQRKPSSAYSGAAVMPERASRSDAVTSLASLPIDETMPMPVTATRRMLSREIPSLLKTPRRSDQVGGV